MESKSVFVGSRPWDVMLPSDLSWVKIKFALFKSCLARIDTNREGAICVAAWPWVLSVRIHVLLVDNCFVEVVAASSEAVCLLGVSQVDIARGATRTSRRLLLFWGIELRLQIVSVGRGRT